MTDTAKNTAAAEEGVYETPEDIAACKESYTGQYLKKLLK